MRKCILITLISLVWTSCRENDLKFNVQLVDAIEGLKPTLLGDSLQVFERNTGGKDVIVFVSDFFYDREVIETYLNTFTTLGFDIRIVNLNNKSFFEAKSSIEIVIENLIKGGYAERIVIYGKESMSSLVLSVGCEVNVRRIVVENISDDDIDEALKNIGCLKTGLLIFHGERTQHADWKNSVQLYSEIKDQEKRLVILPGVGGNDIHYDQFYFHALQSELPTLLGANTIKPFDKFVW